MIIKEYMRTHPGVYVLAESLEEITVTDLAPELAEREVEEYVLTGGHAGGERIRLHTRSGNMHVLTYFVERETVDRSAKN